MERFRKLEDRYIDMLTGLEWCDGTHNVKYNWKDAVELCQGLTMGGYEDWKLPTREQLITLIDDQIYNPCTKLPGIKPSNYWSSTTYADSSDGAWRVYFYYGSVSYGDKSSTYYVRATRGRQGEMK